jgi:hypothetical protein
MSFEDITQNSSQAPKKLPPMIAVREAYSMTTLTSPRKLLSFQLERPNPDFR